MAQATADAFTARRQAATNGGMTSPRIWTAALVIIGDEILSGRTQDLNLAYLGKWLNLQGIALAEARVVPDRIDAIVAAVNACRAAHDYVFTTGGIGPTHDDLTREIREGPSGPEIAALFEAFHKMVTGQGGPEGLGKLTATAGVNFNQTDATRISATPSQLTALGVVTPLFDIVEKVRMEDGQPKNVFNIGLNWVINDFTVFLRNVRYGEVSAAQSDASGWIAARNAALSPGFDIELLPPAPGAPAGNMVPVQTFGAKWLTDLDVSWRFDERTTISVGANNLFDVYPDQNIASTSQWLGSDNAGIFPYSGISPFGFNGRFYYGKISYKW